MGEISRTLLDSLDCPVFKSAPTILNAAVHTFPSPPDRQTQFRASKETSLEQYYASGARLFSASPTCAEFVPPSSISLGLCDGRLFNSRPDERVQVGTGTSTKAPGIFERRAAEIGRGISTTMGKLEKLAQLAKRKTLFDDRPIEINELTSIIKQDLSSLNQQIGSLQALTR